MIAPTAVRVGLASLGLNPLRTALSTLGIIVGTAALVAVLALGDGVERYVRRQIERTTDLQALVLTPRTARFVDGQVVPLVDYPVFTRADADTAQGLAGAAGEAVLAITGATLITVPDSAARAARVTASDAGITAFQELELARGRFFTAAEAATPAHVVVLSHRFAAERGLDPGDSVRLGSRDWEVVGVLAGEDDERGLAAFVPLALAADALLTSATSTTPVLLVKAARVEDVATVRVRLEAWLARRVGLDWKDRVAVGTRSERLAQVQQGMLVFRILMGAITGISLLVGGIGIMNVLLASVAERTREIGIRKAVGARRRDVLGQFLAESIAITGAGAAVGTAVGLAGAFAVTAVMRARTEALVYAAFTGGTVLTAAGAAVAVGIAFGIYPALRAARLSPVDAMRHE